MNVKEGKADCLYRAAKPDSWQYFPLLPMEEDVKGRKLLPLSTP